MIYWETLVVCQIRKNSFHVLKLVGKIFHGLLQFKCVCLYIFVCVLVYVHVLMHAVCVPTTMHD